MDSVNRPKLLVVGLGVSVIIFCVIVLGYVGTCPDIGLRGLLSDSDMPVKRQGMVIRQIAHLGADGHLDVDGIEPQPGDLLTRIHTRRIRSFMDFSVALHSLKNARIESGGQVDTTRWGTLLSEPDQYPPLIQLGDERAVEIEFIRAGTTTPVVSLVKVRSLPLAEILLSFVWLVLQFCVFAVSALAAWHRPFDRSARLFFAMCAVGMGGFIGGFHWWVITSNLLLNIPFTVCAVLVPVVSLHFFLSYPRRVGPMERFPKQTVVAIYSVPVLTAAVMTGLLCVAWWLTAPGMTERAIGIVVSCMATLRWLVYAYLDFAVVCFCGMLIALAREYLSSSGPVERSQMAWMLRAGLISAIPIGYTLYLALFRQTEFALGSARVPMFLASLSFMLAYTVGIVRFKLMLVDQLVTRGMLYHFASQGLTLGYGVCVALAAFLADDLNVTGTVPGWFQQVLSLGVLLTFLVVVLTWSRDRLQQGIDRRFYREKYQLDRALQRVNQALDQLEDRHTLGLRMLSSCRDVLGSRVGSLFLRDTGSGTFQLAATDGMDSQVPEQLGNTKELLLRLEQDKAIMRSSLGASDPLYPTMRTLHAELIFPLEADGEVDGLVVLARRLNGAPYTAEDLTFLATLGQFTAVSLRSVKVHQDFARLNEELQLKATKISEQRRQIAMMQAELMGRAGSPAGKPQRQPEELRREMIKGNSPAIQNVLDTVRKVAASESTVLIQGASGTGKELLAQAIHDNSSRHAGPMVRVHCAALSPSLLESELFGHVKGAFTGAHRDRVGRFEMANGGTLFLDEIGDISLETQIKLLRVLQTRSFEPVGGARTVEVDVRLITATHQNLLKLISEGRFREDLYYRLNVVNITLPTLSQRREDIFELALHFLKRASVKSNKPVTHIDEETHEALMNHSWPGNIRELENIIERAVVMCEGDRITVAELPDEFRAAIQPTPGSVSRSQMPSAARSPVVGTLPASVPARPPLVSPPVRSPVAVRAVSPPTGWLPDGGPVADTVSAHNDHSLETPPPEIVRSVRSAMVPPQLSVPPRGPASLSPPPEEPQVDAVETEYEILERALQECGGNKSEAARKLGIPRSTFFSRLRKAGLT